MLFPYYCMGDPDGGSKHDSLETQCKICFYGALEMFLRALEDGLCCSICLGCYILQPPENIAAASLSKTPSTRAAP